MTKKIAWITDTGAQFDVSFIEKHNVHVLSLGVVFADGVFKETVDMSHDDFYDKLRVAKTHPKTTQPAIGEMLTLYEKLAAEGYDYAIALHVSSGLSGTFETAQSAAKMTDFKVYPIDSKIGSFPMIKMIEIGDDLLKKGHTIEEVLDAIQEIKDNAKLSFIPANLNQLHKSGRVSGTQAFLSNLLNIKVVITFDNGIPLMKEKVRANVRAKKNVTALLRSDMEKGTVPEVAVIHCGNEKDSETWKAELLEMFPTLTVRILPLSACVGVHAGEGTTGLSWVKYK